MLVDICYNATVILSNPCWSILIQISNVEPMNLLGRSLAFFNSFGTDGPSCTADRLTWVGFCPVWNGSVRVAASSHNSKKQRMSGRDSWETRARPGWSLAWIETAPCVQVLQTFWLLDYAGAVNVLLGLKKAAPKSAREPYKAPGNYGIYQRL